MTDRLWSWGVDLSTLAISFGFASDDLPVDLAWTEIEIPPAMRREAGDKRALPDLAWLHERIVAEARERAQTHPPIGVWVEQPSGTFTKNTLVYTVGVVIAALQSVVGEIRDVWPEGVPVRQIASSSWRAAALGSGRAKKVDAVVWATALAGTALPSVDVCEACGVAVGGRSEITNMHDAIAAPS